MKRITGSRRYRLAGPLALAILQACQVAQAEEEADTNKFTISGDFRAGWLNYDYSNPDGLPTINKDHKD